MEWLLRCPRFKNLYSILVHLLPRGSFCRCVVLVCVSFRYVIAQESYLFLVSTASFHLLVYIISAEKREQFTSKVVGLGRYSV